MHGYGEFIEYYGPEYLLNKDGTAKPMNKYKGNFLKGKKEGMFEVYQDLVYKIFPLPLLIDFSFLHLYMFCKMMMKIIHDRLMID